MRKVLIALLALPIVACQQTAPKEETHDHGHHGHEMGETMLHYPNEKHLTNIRQLTFGGDNAEAYFSFDDRMLTFQSNFNEWGLECDQIFYFDIENDDLSKGSPQMISTSKGRTTCAYFMPGDTSIVFASTHSGGDACPHDPPRGENYTWPIYSDYDIYVSDLKGNILTQLTDRVGYDAEATLSPDGKTIVFTSDRSGDLELWTMNTDGTNLKQVTTGLGYDGGAFFSPDGKQLVFRASRPQTEEEIAKYKDLLSQGLVEPTSMELYVCNVDGSELRQVTKLGRANWAPFFHPSQQKIIFSSNHHTERGFPFNLFMINVDGTGLEQITFDTQFDAFPMFSYSGKKLVWASNRVNGSTRHTNLFIADWVD